MAEMTKKLHFLKSGTEQTAKAYSTTAEAGSSYITNVIDNTTCYIPIGSTSDSRATYGRVLKGGTTYAILSQAKPAYTEQSWTAAGTYTWTCPAGVTRVRVAVCGGGAGGISVNPKFDNYPHKYYAYAGGDSKFGNLMTATGGVSTYLFIDRSGQEYDYDFYFKEATCTGGTPNGRAGSYDKEVYHVSTCVGGTGFALSFTLTNGSYGNGGTAQKVNYGCAYAVGGGSGGYNTGYVNVTAGTTYTIVVGAGGNKYTIGGSSGGTPSANNGNSGFVLIAFGGSI